MENQEQQTEEMTPEQIIFNNLMQEIKDELDENHGVGNSLTTEYEQDFQLQICQKLAIFIKENESLKKDVENLKRQVFNKSK